MRDSDADAWSWVNVHVVTFDPTDSEEQSSGWFEYTDNELPRGSLEGKTVSYRALRVVYSEEGSESNPVSVTLPTLMPQNVAASQVAAGVALSWDAPSAEGVTGYKVLRQLPGLLNAPYTVHLTTDASTTSVIDDDTLVGLTYKYRVFATYEEGNSRKSAGVQIALR